MVPTHYAAARPLRPQLGTPHRQGGSAPLHPLRPEDADDRLPDRSALDPEDSRPPRPQHAAPGHAPTRPRDPPRRRARRGLGRARRVGVSSPPVAPRGEPSTQEVTLRGPSPSSARHQPAPAGGARDLGASRPSQPSRRDAPLCRGGPPAPVGAKGNTCRFDTRRARPALWPVSSWCLSASPAASQAPVSVASPGPPWCRSGSS